MSIKKDNEMMARLYTEGAEPGQDPIDSEVGGYETHDRSDAVEDGEDLNPMKRFNYLLSQLSDMKRDLSLGVDADSTIFQEIRHVAEQIATWCDDQHA